MIEITHKVVAGIPLLEVVEHDLAKEPLPTVIFYHGWTSYKENVLTHGYELAKQGIRALLPEALYHGERQDAQPTESHFLDFWSIVTDNINNFPKIIAEYTDAGLTAPERVGATGLSMGGITTCGLMATNPAIKSAVCLMGTPRFLDFTHYLMGENQIELTTELATQLNALKKIELSAQPEKIDGRYFHFWHGTTDEEVPYTLTHDWFEAIKDESYARHVTFHTTNDGHKVPYLISVEMAEFFKKTL